MLNVFGINPFESLHVTSQLQSIMYLLVFQMCIVSGSEMQCCPAWSSSRSKKYFTASGTGRLVLRMTVNRSSTNFCNVPWKTRRGKESQRDLKHRGCSLHNNLLEISGMWKASGAAVNHYHNIVSGQLQRTWFLCMYIFLLPIGNLFRHQHWLYCE